MIDYLNEIPIYCAMRLILGNKNIPRLTLKRNESKTALGAGKQALRNYLVAVGGNP